MSDWYPWEPPSWWERLWSPVNLKTDMERYWELAAKERMVLEEKRRQAELDDMRRLLSLPPKGYEPL